MTSSTAQLENIKNKINAKQIIVLKTVSYKPEVQLCKINESGPPIKIKTLFSGFAAYYLVYLHDKNTTHYFDRNTHRTYLDSLKLKSFELKEHHQTELNNYKMLCDIDVNINEMLSQFSFITPEQLRQHTVNYISFLSELLNHDRSEVRKATRLIKRKIK